MRLKIKDMQRAQEVAGELAQSLPPGMIVRDWTRQNRTWFAAVQVEKRMMFIILALIVAVAAFNLVSTLVMTVTEKQSDIAILRTLGASPSSIMAVFMVQGALIGVLGTLLGVAQRALRRQQPRHDLPGDRAHRRLPADPEGHLLHQLAAVRSARVGHRADRGDLDRAVAGGDAVSELARVARQAGGGAAL